MLYRPFRYSIGLWRFIPSLQGKIDAIVEEIFTEGSKGLSKEQKEELKDIITALSLQNTSFFKDENSDRVIEILKAYFESKDEYKNLAWKSIVKASNKLQVSSKFYYKIRGDLSITPRLWNVIAWVLEPLRIIADTVYIWLASTNKGTEEYTRGFFTSQVKEKNISAVILLGKIQKSAKILEMFTDSVKELVGDLNKYKEELARKMGVMGEISKLLELVVKNEKCQLSTMKLDEFPNFKAYKEDNNLEMKNIKNVDEAKEFLKTLIATLNNEMSKIIRERDVKQREPFWGELEQNILSIDIKYIKAFLEGKIKRLTTENEKFEDHDKEVQELEEVNEKVDGFDKTEHSVRSDNKVKDTCSAHETKNEKEIQDLQNMLGLVNHIERSKNMQIANATVNAPHEGPTARASLSGATAATEGVEGLTRRDSVEEPNQR
jgi:hypothetical protein